ncbi:MAG: hypothetical protein QM724_06105 [Flavobacteriales bacterium]
MRYLPLALPFVVTLISCWSITPSIYVRNTTDKLAIVEMVPLDKEEGADTVWSFRSTLKVEDLDENAYKAFEGELPATRTSSGNYRMVIPAHGTVIIAPSAPQHQLVFFKQCWIPSDSVLLDLRPPDMCWHFGQEKSRSAWYTIMGYRKCVR